MTPDDRACLALDLGGATTSVAILGRVADRWRLVGSSAGPVSVSVEAVIAMLVDRLAAADPDLLATFGGAAAVDRWPRLVARTAAPPRLAVLAASERTLVRLREAGRRSGWVVRGASAETADPLEMSRVILAHDVDTVLVGASDPPATDERAVLADLAELVAAAAGRRPEMTVVLSGSLADHAERFERPAAPTLLIAPEATAGDPPGDALRLLLEELRPAADDGRRASVRAAGSLAAALGRRIEIVEIGQRAGLRVTAWPAGAAGEAHVRWATVAEAALVPDPIDDEVVDGVLGWCTLPLDRYRLRDRLGELRIAPWVEAHGDGAPLRMAAARAALARLVARTPELDLPVPDLVVAAGGAWSVAPGAAVGLALADVLRRPGASQLAVDHAHLLGPLGTIADEATRRAVVGDLADDLFAPLGSVVIPAGLRAGRSAGRLVVHSAAGDTELDLVPGGLELVDLPPGELATADLRFRDAVLLGTHGKRFAIDVAGGLGGLLVDLRDIPLRLPDRADRRRELLGAWQRALWSGLE